MSSHHSALSALVVVALLASASAFMPSVHTPLASARLPAAAPAARLFPAPVGASLSQGLSLRAGRTSVGPVMQSAGAVTPENPLKVIVAGGGVGGMFLAKALQKKGIEVQVLEKTNKFARFGGPIQLASNALATIKGIDENLFDRVMSKFTFTGTRTNGIKDGIRTQWYTKFQAISDMADYFTLAYTGVIDRPDLQELLLDEIGGDATVQRDAEVVKYEQLPGSEGVKATLKDGTEVTGDILVGSDGIWSSIRAQMWNQDARGPNSGTTYSGYTCFAGDTIQKTDYYFDVGYQVYIGPGKYFVTSDVGKGRTQWYAFLALPEGSKSRASNKEYLYELFNDGPEGRWSEEVFKVLDATPDDQIDQRDLFDRPPSVLKSWSEGHVTMIGDSVHPMMPNLGQGGCQAIEDAYVLAERLGEVKDRSQIEGILGGFYRERLPRTAIVQGLSRLASDLIVSAFDTPYQLPSQDDRFGPLGGPLKINSVFTALLRPFMGAIFYAQFGYLYTFHPKKCTKQEVDRLVDEVMTRHRVDAEAVWEKVGLTGKDEGAENREGSGLSFR
uniref:FAD-binding domain-containing protein n=2 Tax=Hemiselmis andersenii TaxID=464988 RepID=A0A6U5CIA3_HEMAN|mmetsp:Transcript_62926/g.151307  ORF Transcript_62926/g.151307 Transcript_62926/m.151307 type:complete len:557 (+) Transcript_62926:38-1708(+)